MVILDANILIYTHHSDTKQHKVVSAWFESQMTSAETLGLTWAALWAFMRVSTNSKLWERPPTPEEAFDRVAEWLQISSAVLIGPGQRHLSIMRSLALQSGAKGPMLSDVALAAIAIEHAAILASTDRDFRRFSGLRWVNPLEED